MYLATIVYNLKKLLNFTKKLTKIGVNGVDASFLEYIPLIATIRFIVRPQYFIILTLYKKHISS